MIGPHAQMRIGRRHHVGEVGGGDPFQQLALSGLAGNDSKSSLHIPQRCLGAVRNIKAQARFAVAGIRAMTFITFVGKYRTDVAIIADDIRDGLRLLCAALFMVEAGRNKANPYGNSGKYRWYSSGHVLLYEHDECTKNPQFPASSRLKCPNNKPPAR